MDYERICNTEGCRVEDLNETNRAIIAALNILYTDFKEDVVENISMCFGDSIVDDTTILGKMIAEIRREFKESVEKWLYCKMLEMQIALAEDEADA